MAVVGWGSTYGAIYQAVRRVFDDGHAVAHINIWYIVPFTSNLGDMLSVFELILVPELNAGQLVQVLRSTFMLPAEGLNKVAGKPFKVTEVEQAIRSLLER